MYVLYYMGDYSVLYVWGPGVGGLYCIIERIILDFRGDYTVFWGDYTVL